jgi:hypothetical protein
MDSPWELKANDSRTENSLTTFIIFCEDQLDEPIYFRSFEKQFPKIKINTIEAQKSGKLNLDNTIHQCFVKGLIEVNDGKYFVRDDVGGRIWCVYDRDLEHTDFGQINPVNGVSFTTAIQAAESTGLRVAWSNDSFELWILLHFENAPEQPVHRQHIYDRLTEIFRNIVPRSAELDAITARAGFTYKHKMKRRENFIQFVLPRLVELRDEAIQRASLLEANYNGMEPYHHCNPCTKVHHLVTSIIAEGQ